jgi:hypothetical protein
MSAQPDTDLYRYPLSVDRYEAMGRAGYLDDADRIELLRGQIVSMPGPGPTHASVVKRLNQLFVQRLGDRAIVSVQDPIRLVPYSEPQPDLALLVPRDDFYAARHPGPDDIYLVVEVCDSSLAFDRDIKLPIYASAKLPEVWLVDVKKHVILTHRDPVDGAYANGSELHRGTTVTTGAPLDLELYVSTILR